MSINLIEINSCEVCANANLIEVLNLGSHSLCDGLVTLEGLRIFKKYSIAPEIISEGNKVIIYYQII